MKIKTQRILNPPSSPFIRGGITPPFIKGSLGGILCNSRGISVLFLVIAMLLMITIGYVFSYLIPTKQKSVKFPIYSTQAFFIAQSGLEYAIRYCSDQGWRGVTDGGTYDLTRLNGSYPLGNGTFALNYDQLTNTLTSTGQIMGSSENRVVQVSNFSPFLRLIFDPDSPAPCRTVPNPIPGGLTRNRTARFYIKNVRTTDVILNSFSASWAGGAGSLQGIYMDVGAGWVLKFTGTYNTGNPPPIRNFNRPIFSPTQTIIPNQVISVLLYFSFNLAGDRDIIITFYTATGDGYTFNLDAAGNALPTC